VFFEGQIFDAYILAAKIIRSAKRNIILIDNFIDESVLILLSKKQKAVHAIILTANIHGQLSLDIAKANAQYPVIEVKVFKQSHDRFLIIDETEVYHLGASLKDLGKKWFAFLKNGFKSFRFIYLQYSRQNKNLSRGNGRVNFRIGFVSCLS